MKTWLRVVLPPAMAITVFGLVYLVMEGVVWWQVWWNELAGPSAEMRSPRDVLLWLTAIAYGGYRVMAFHPMYRPDYRKLLLLTPWTVRKPLPVGPIHVVWQDIVVVAALVCLGLPQAYFNPQRLPLICLTAYLISSTVTFFPARLWVYFYGMVFGLGLLLRVWPYFTLAVPIAGLLYVFGYMGLRRALARLPHDAELYDENVWLTFSTAKVLKHKRSKMVGWPFEFLRPQPPEHAVPYSHGVLVSLLVGWLAYAVLAVKVDQMAIEASLADQELAQRIEGQTKLSDHATQTLRRELARSGRKRVFEGVTAVLIMVLAYVFIGLIVGRIAVYCAGHHPPINLWGRLWTFRWIIPSYDYVFLAPLCATAAFCGCVYVIARWHIDPVIGVPVTATLMLLITLNMGPRLADWRLKSPCWILPSQAQKNKREYTEV